MSDLEAEPLPNFSTDLPTHYGIHLSLRLNTATGQLLHFGKIEERLQQCRKTTAAFLDFCSGNPHMFENAKAVAFLESQKTAYEKMLLAKYRLQALQSALKTTNRDFAENRRHTLDLTLGNFDNYKAEVQHDFFDAALASLDTLDTGSQAAFALLLRGDLTFQLLKNAAFVLQNPEKPLPDDMTDDDVAVAGGKISLKDPLSLNYFVDPVASRKCGHVYEKEHIERLIGLAPQISCPVTGCDAYLTRADLAPDQVMALRVKVYLATRSREQASVVRI